MRVILTDEALRSAAAELREYRLSQLPVEEDFENEFSPEFEAAAQKLERRFEMRQSVRKMARSAAAVFLVLAVSLGAWLGVDSEARADFASWLREVYEDSVIYRYAGGRSEDTELPRIELGWVPDGYVLTEEYEIDNGYIAVYENGEDVFVVSCEYMTGNSVLSADFLGEGYEERDVEVNGIRGEMYISSDGSDSNTLVLFDDSGLVYIIDAFIDEVVILHIAENIKLAE